VGTAPAHGVEEIGCTEAWARLQAGSSRLVDVRTRAEWSFVGVPDLSQLDQQPILIEWQSFPDGMANATFVPALMEQLEKGDVGEDVELLFLCRSGARSRQAAKTVVAHGQMRCESLTDGFEGPLDENQRRGRLSGWKVDNLPWVQG